MEKVVDRTWTGGEVELTCNCSDDLESSMFTRTSVHPSHRLDAIKIRKRVCTYIIASMFLSFVLASSVYWMPNYAIIMDSSQEHVSSLEDSDESQTPPASPMIPSETVYPVSIPSQAHIPDPISMNQSTTTCRSLQSYQALYDSVRHGMIPFCDQIGQGKECICQNPTLPAKHPDDWKYQKLWNNTLLRHVDLLKQYNNVSLDVLLLGDSLTEHWLGTDFGRRNHQYDKVHQVYQHFFRDRSILGLALGIGGDRCPQLLYRMQHGETLPSAEVIWINIGTNDLGGDHCNIKAVIAGNIAVIEYVLSVIDQTKTRVVLNSLLPRSGQYANDTNLAEDLTWSKIRKINHHLECYVQLRATTALEFFNTTHLFLSRDDSNHRNATLYQDSVHLSYQGYMLWGEAVVQRVGEIKEEMSEYNDSSRLSLCTDITSKYFDDLVNAVCTTSTNRCKDNQICECPDPQIPTTNEPVMHARWKKSFERNQHQLDPYLETNSTIELLLMGDSLTELWLGTVLGNPTWKYVNIPEVFTDIFSNESTVAMGISADQSPHLLHRIQNGELPFQLNVSIVWLLIGTNDINGGCNADAITAANVIIVQEIMRRQPNAKVVINSLLPRMDKGYDTIQQVNSQLKCFTDSMGDSVTFFNATGLFVNSDGTTNVALYTDAVHPNKEGYKIWGRAIKSFKHKLLSNKDR